MGERWRQNPGEALGFPFEPESHYAYCCDIMHHYSSLLAARDGPSPLKRKRGEGRKGILVLRARLADFHG